MDVHFGVSFFYLGRMPICAPCVRTLLLCKQDVFSTGKSVACGYGAGL